MTSLDVSRRGLFKGGAVLGAATGLAALTDLQPRPAAADPTLSAAQRAWNGYGDWNEQRIQGWNSKYCLGYLDNFLSRDSAVDPGAVEVWCAYKRAEADYLYRMGITDPAAIADGAWRGGAFCSKWYARLAGDWIVDVTFPTRVGAAFALMIYGKDPSQAPYGEFDVLEGSVGQTVFSNLHWRQPDGSTGSDGMVHSNSIFDGKKHRIRVNAQPGQLKLYVDDSLWRTVTSPYVPYNNPSNWVLQVAGDKTTMMPGGSGNPDYRPWGSFHYEEKFTIKVIQVPSTPA